ncbi:MAG: hypothetical protein DWQ10_12900 [Calditrichaeota bacterium]|nr:MAG: hypothetical protein DWQ10_12900 [Calditrichota bacterium]
MNQYKTISLLFLLKNESAKLICYILAVIEQLYINNLKNFKHELKNYIRNTIESDIMNASNRESTFEVVWLIFFSRYLSLGITNFREFVKNNAVKENKFYKSVITSQQQFYRNSGIKLFRKPKDCRETSLMEQLSVFD